MPYPPKNTIAIISEVRGYGRMPYPPKNTTAIISGVRGYGRMPYPPNIKMCNLERLHPPGDSGGIQTHDLQNFFSTKSFCSKNKKCATSKGCTPW